MSKPDKTLLILELDAGVKSDFKKLCVDKEVAMSSVVRRCVKAWVDKQNKNVVY